MDDLAEQFSGMIKRNFNPIFRRKTVEEVFSQMLSNAKSFESQLKSGYLKRNKIHFCSIFE
jgi:hypothetical protein